MPPIDPAMPFDPTAKQGRIRRICTHFEQLSNSARQPQRNESAEEELRAITHIPPPSVIDEHERQPTPIVPPRPPRRPKERSNPSPQAIQQPTPPLTPERDEFQEQDRRTPSPVFELETTAPLLTPIASIYSSSSLQEKEPQLYQAHSSDVNSTIEGIQTQLQEVTAQVSQLEEEQKTHLRNLETVTTRLHNLEVRYATALKTIERNEAEITALRTELLRVREQEEASRKRANELSMDLRAAMEREFELMTLYNRLRDETAERTREAEVRAEVRAQEAEQRAQEAENRAVVAEGRAHEAAIKRRKRRSSGAAGRRDGYRSEKGGRHGRRSQPQQGAGIMCACM